MPRRDIADQIWQVSDAENDPFIPKYYYRCSRCLSFSAP
jgi:hypothetical protein